ncbi:MAG: YCF48-related protein [Balneolaceae bacterium]
MDQFKIDPGIGLSRITVALILMFSVLSCGGDDGNITGPGGGNGNGNGGNGDGDQVETISLDSREGNPFSLIELSLTEAGIQLSEEQYSGTVGDVDISALNAGEEILVFIVPNLEEGSHDVSIDAEDVRLEFNLDVSIEEEIENANQYVDELVSEVTSGTEYSSNARLEEAKQSFEALPEAEQEIAARVLSSNRAVLDQLIHDFQDLGSMGQAVAQEGAGLQQEECELLCSMERATTIFNLSANWIRTLDRMSGEDQGDGFQAAIALMSGLTESLLPAKESLAEDLLSRAFLPEVDRVTLTWAEEANLLELTFHPGSGEHEEIEITSGFEYGILLQPVHFRTLNADDSDHPTEWIVQFVEQYLRFSSRVLSFFEVNMPEFNDHLEPRDLDDPEGTVQFTHEDESIQTEEFPFADGQFQFSVSFAGEQEAPYPFEVGVHFNYEEFSFSEHLEITLLEDESNGSGDEEPSEWTSVDLGLNPEIPYFITSIDFVNSSVGMLAAYDGERNISLTFLTTNGGEEWTLSNGELPDMVDLAVTSPKGNAVAVSLWGDILLFDSEIGMWTNRDFYSFDPDFELDADIFLNAVYAENNDVWVVGAAYVEYDNPEGFSPRENKPFIFHFDIADGTGEIQLDPRETNLFGELLDIDFHDGNTGIAVGENGNLFRTTNGGETWSEEFGADDIVAIKENPQVFFPQRVSSIHFYNEDLVWVSGFGGQILHSSDSGESWDVQQEVAEDKPGLSQIQFVSSQRGIAAGGESGLFHTENGGSTWIQMEVPEDLGLRLFGDFHFFDDGLTGWFVGSAPGGALIRYEAEE